LAVDLDAIERVLRERMLVAWQEVDLWLGELEAAAEAELPAPAGWPTRTEPSLQLRIMAEYRALRTLALRHGWLLPESDWPLQSSRRGQSASAQARVPLSIDSGSPAEELLDQVRVVAIDASEPADVDGKTIVLRESRT
jgi:hypothetical protein